MAFHRIRDAEAPELRFGPIGRCIYCRATGSLTDEHVIPDGLGGNLILAKASCKDCAAITGHNEQQILQRMYRAVRAALGIRSRKSIKRGNALATVPILLGRPDQGGTRPHPLDGKVGPPYGVISFLTQSSPGLLMEYPASIVLWERHHAEPRDIDERIRNVKHLHRWVGFETQVNFGALAQMLSKIAHAYAVSQIGLDSFEPYLVGGIVSRTIPSVNTRLIGSRANNDGGQLSLHEIELDQVRSRNRRDPNLYVVCRIRLFSLLATPTYEIVVGRVL